MDYPGDNISFLFSYNASGALWADPAAASYGAEANMAASLSADATLTLGLIGQDVTEYHGPIIYRNGKVDMVLFPGATQPSRALLSPSTTTLRTTSAIIVK